MYAIKVKDRYIKFTDGRLKYVNTRDEASHFKTLNGVKWAIEELENQQNYTEVIYEEFTMK